VAWNAKFLLNSKKSEITVFDMLIAVVHSALGFQKKKNNRDNCSEHHCTQNRDLHDFFSHGTVVPHFLSGHLNPWRLPSKTLVFARAGSIQKRVPHLGHFK
jgi:hypothetical protein